MKMGQGKRIARDVSLSVIAFLSISTASFAQGVQDVDIKSEPAKDAILALGAQTGVQVIAPQGGLEGVRTNPVSGRFTALAAARRMFEGTGLTLEQVGESIVVRTADVAVPGSEEIVVTGSRVRKTRSDALQSIQVTDETEIQRRGYTNVLQALETTPGFGLAESSASGIGGSGSATFNTGASFANFFNLGSQRTLTLVNGRRFVSSNVIAGGNASLMGAGGQVDLNVIPVGLIDRIETVAIGGAPVYGSDAIAGTVNIILKKDFEGLNISAQQGIAERGDAASYTVRLLSGGNFSEGRGNITAAFEYNKQNGLLNSDRFVPYRMVPNTANTGPADGIPGRIVAEDFRFTGVTNGGLPFRNLAAGMFGTDYPGLVLPGVYPNGNYIFDASGNPVQFGAGGNLVAYDPGQVVQSSSGIPIASIGGDGLNTGEIASLYAPTTRTLFNVVGRYELTSGIEATFEGSYARSRGVEQAELSNFFSPVLTGRSLSVSMDNAFLNPQARDILAANGVTNTFQLARNNSDLLSPASTTVEIFRFVGGLNGSLEAFGRDLRWDVSFNQGRSRGTTKITYINDARFQEAANAIFDINGNIVCASGNAACAPLDIFGVGNFSEAARDYVTDPGVAINTSKQRVITANLSGELPFQFSAMPIQFNVGTEFRREKGSFEPDAVLQAGYTSLGVPLLGGYTPTRGAYSTREVYGELMAPIITPDSDTPLIDSLAIEGALRYVDHSLTSGATTWSAGARFAPRLPGGAAGLMLRGVYTRSIRSPAIAELFLGRTPVQLVIQDPCDSLNFRNGTNPAAREANCRAGLAAVGAGDPETFSQTISISSKGFSEGNRNLSNEKAESWSLGFNYEPVGIPGLRLSGDWSSITLRDGITAVNIQTLVNLCYDSPTFPDTAACDAFQRQTAPGGGRGIGDIQDGFVSGYINAATIKFAGAIGTAEYRFSLMGDDELRLGGTLFYTDRFDFQSVTGQPVIDYRGTTGLLNSVPKFRSRFDVGYSTKALDVSVQALWTDAVKFDRTATIETDNVNDVNDYWLFNGSIGYKVADTIRFQFSVNNLFDKSIPYAARARGTYRSYDVLGRTFLFGVGATF